MSYSYTHGPCADSWLSFVFIGLYVKQAQLCFFPFFFFLMLMMNQFLLQEPAMFAPLQRTQAFLPSPSVHIQPSSAVSSWSTEISETKMIPIHRNAVFRAGVAKRDLMEFSTFCSFYQLLHVSGSTKKLGFFFHSFRLKFIFFKSKRRMHGNSSPALPGKNVFPLHPKKKSPTN